MNGFASNGNNCIEINEFLQAIQLIIYDMLNYNKNNQLLLLYENNHKLLIEKEENEIEKIMLNICYDIIQSDK